MYIPRARPSCLILLKQEVCRALARAWAKTGKRMAARMAMIAITTSSSIRVKALRRISGSPCGSVIPREDKAARSVEPIQGPAAFGADVPFFVDDGTRVFYLAGRPAAG